MTIKEIEIQLALGTLTEDMKRELAGNNRTPKKILTKLSTDEDWIVRHNVADNINTPKEILIILSKDKVWFVRNQAHYYLKLQRKSNENQISI